MQQWAPLVFLAPGEKFNPSDVSEFLDNMMPIPLQDTGSTVYENPAELKENLEDLPKGRLSETWYLTTKEGIGE